MISRDMWETFPCVSCLAIIEPAIMRIDRTPRSRISALAICPLVVLVFACGRWHPRAWSPWTVRPDFGRGGCATDCRSREPTSGDRDEYGYATVVSRSNTPGWPVWVVGDCGYLSSRRAAWSERGRRGDPRRDCGRCRRSEKWHQHRDREEEGSVSGPALVTMAVDTDQCLRPLREPAQCRASTQ
jgi:hypothetical protein